MREARYLSKEQLRELCARIYEQDRPVFLRRRLLAHFGVPRLERLGRPAAAYLLANWSDLVSELLA